jgi:tetratricopeptide (TPR) repeat protein
MTLITIVNSANATVPGEGVHSLTIRSWKHPDFHRIVFEGHESVISKGTVSQKEKDLIVSFRDGNFEIKKKSLPLTFKVNNNSVRFSLKEVGKLKTFTLTNPSRLVIDVFREDNAAGKRTKTKSKLTSETKKADETKTNASAERAKKSHANKKDEIRPTKSRKKYDEQDIIPERFKAMWTLLEAGHFYAVLKELPLHKPEDAESLAAFYYIYARANIIAKEYLDAVKYLRLAYIYGTDNSLKEFALIKRAEVYTKLGFFHEARADYLVFIRDFPSSEFIEMAHHGLAENLYKIGLFREALKHYKKGGTEPAVLFGMANALQKLEKVEDAKKTYAEAILKEKTYPENSPETYYLMGENMRMSGDMARAKQHMSIIDSGPFRDNATISLGLIAMEESDMKRAVKQFKTAARSRDQKVSVQALFNLSLAYIKEGKFKEAVSSLEEIRHNHIDSYMYKDALLVLSKLYKKEGRIKESVSLLKELVYGKQPPGEAFGELEEIALEAGDTSKEDELTLRQLWNEVGQWLVDERREEFLVKVTKRLRYEGKPFIDLCSWLVDNASERVRGRAAIDLADYYIGIGNVNMSQKYLDIAKESKESGDQGLRVESKIFRANGKHQAALKNIMMIKETDESDLARLSNIISDLNTPESKDVKEAIAFYEGVLNKSEWDADSYINLADILYSNREHARALTYYRIALQKGPENKWAMYRVGQGTGIGESKNMFSRLQKEDNLIGRLAKTKLMEMALQHRVEEVY